MGYSERVTELLESNKDYSSVKVAVTEVAATCGVSEKIVRDDMKKKGSDYHHIISGFIDGKPVGRITLINRFTRQMEKIYKQIEKNVGHKLSIDEKQYVMELIEVELMKTA